MTDSMKDIYTFGVIKIGLLAGYMPKILTTFVVLYYTGEKQVLYIRICISFSN